MQTNCTGNLAIIDSIETQDFLDQNLALLGAAVDDDIWFGAQYHFEDGDWRWTTDTLNVEDLCMCCIYLYLYLK